ncbi:MAG: hypothetical protein HY562_06480 [Ignavibacteriales bacterium]|nr:hypothetical protein [Ignavibacteriales bacterium]
MTPEPPRRIAKVVIRLDVSSGVPRDYRPKFEHICRTCPVALSVHPDVHVDLQFTYPD